MSGCPSGCPCEGYDCSYESNFDSILILNNQNAQIVSNNALTEIDHFEYQTAVYHSCSVQWKNQMIVFGGSGEHKRQISQVINCQLVQTGQLMFDLDFGTCTIGSKDRIFVCFNDSYDEYSKCRKSLGPLEEFEEVDNAQHDHYRSRISSSEGNYTENFLTPFQPNF